LYVDVRDNPASEFATMGARPKRFVLKSFAADFKAEDLQPLDLRLTTRGPKYSEKDLHPLMVYFGFYYMRAFFKTISHNKSSKKGFGEWVHPDLVGCYFPFSEWEPEVVEVSSLLGDTAIRLYSFELKRELSIANLREAFFQAVSNSSWAHEGYLVAAEIDTNDDFLNELNRLSTAFGIGIIRLDAHDPDSSKIFLPARTKDTMDWDTVNKLASINPDFREFLKRIRIDSHSREVRREMYDKVVSKEALVEVFEKSNECT